MKFILLAISLTILSSNTFACSCSDYPMAHDEVILEAIEQKLGYKTKIDFKTDVEAIKAYPTLAEKLNLSGFKGTSCEVKGPQNETLDYCSPRAKYDYIVKAEKCIFVVQANSNSKEAKAKIKKMNCNR